MYGKYVIDERTLTDIANAIREKEGTTGAIATNDFSDRISSIKTSEDLDAELNTQQEIILAQESLIDEIKTLLETKAAGSGGNLNVFGQTNEPDIKDGIWIKQDIVVSGVNIVDQFNTDLTVSDVTDDSTMPVSIRETGTCAIGDYVYIIGGNTGGASSTIYKYDVNTKTYSTVGYLSQGVYGPAVATDGTDIYIFGGRSGSTGRSTSYKFNTITSSLTQITSMPYGAGQHQATRIGREIFMFGGMNGSVITNACKYNIDTNTYTTIASLPAARNGVAVTSLNGKVYLSGGYGSGDMDLLEYDPAKDAYTKLPTMPISSYCGGMEAFANKVLIVGGTVNDAPHTTVYAYDPVTSTYTLVTAQGGRGRIDCALVGDSIYIPGGISKSSSYSNTMGKITLLSPLPDIESDSDLLILESNSSGPSVKLATIGEGAVTTAVSGVYHYSVEDDTITRVSNYYTGDGEKWNEIGG